MRVAAVGVLAGIARGGGSMLWADGAVMYDEAVRTAVAAMTEEGCPVRSVGISVEGRGGMGCQVPYIH